ncbi:MAG: hypothetical protein L0241_22515 [Planctomycetia bacterium]|nr:hypothetical protein [Planctomycetia bacterium]
MSDTKTREQTSFSSAARKELFLEYARRDGGTTATEVHRAAQQQGDTVTEEAYYNIARRLVHRGLVTTEKVDGGTRYKANTAAQNQWLEEDDLSALVNPEYPLTAITIWKEAQRQINEVSEDAWVELRERLRNVPAPKLFHEAIVSYCDDFLAQVAALADPKNYDPKALANARQEAENSRRLLLQLTKYGLGLSSEAVNLPVSVELAVASYARTRTTSYVNGERLAEELSRRIADEPFIVGVETPRSTRKLVIGAVDGSTRGGILSFLGEEGDFNVGHSPMIAVNTAVGQVNRDVQIDRRRVPAFIRLPEKPEDMQRADNRYTVMAKLFYPDMSDVQYMHSVWNAMDVIEAKAALRLLKRWDVIKAGVEIPAADIVLRDGTVSPQDRDASHYKEISTYGQIVRDMIDTNWEIGKKCREDGQTLAGVVKNAQLRVFAPIFNWYVGQLAAKRTGSRTQLEAWPLQTMNLIPDQVLLTRLLTAGRKKGDAPWDRTCVVLRPFHALTHYARTYSSSGSGPSGSFLNDYNEAREKWDDLNAEAQHFWGDLFRVENDPYVKMLENVFYGSMFVGAVPRLDNERNLPRLEFLVPASTHERDSLPWGSANSHRDRLLTAIHQNGFDVSDEHSMFEDRAKLDILPSLLIRVHDTVKHWAADLVSRVQEYVGFHLARYVKSKKIRGVKVRPFTRSELELLYAQLQQEREAQAGAPARRSAVETAGDKQEPLILEGPENPPSSES